MATANQNYANLLTLRFYNSLISPPRIKPAQIPNINTLTKVGPSATRQPNDCSGFGVQSKVSKINITISFSEDSLGGSTSPLQEYKRCLNANVTSTIQEEETSECFTLDDYTRLVDRYDLNSTPYHDFLITPTRVSSDSVNFSCESFILNASGACDYCTLANKTCAANKTRTYTQSHRVCQNRIGLSTTSIGPNFPEVSPEIQEFIYNNYNTSWVFREALLGIIDAGGLQFETNCACESIPAIKPTAGVRILTQPESTGLSGKTTTTLGSSSTSRSTTSRSTMGGMDMGGMDMGGSSTSGGY